MPVFLRLKISISALSMFRNNHSRRGGELNHCMGRNSNNSPTRGACIRLKNAPSTTDTSPSGFRDFEYANNCCFTPTADNGHTERSCLMLFLLMLLPGNPLVGILIDVQPMHKRSRSNESWAPAESETASHRCPRLAPRTGSVRSCLRVHFDLDSAGNS